MDSSVSPTHGAQEGTAWNSHFGCLCYHPLFVFNQFGHLERCALRPGKVHSPDDWQTVLKPVIARYADRHLMRFFRADSAFAIPLLFETLEATGYSYAIRLRANSVLQGKIADMLKRPVGRPPKGVKRIYGDFEYQAASWDKPRRVVAKVEWHPGELFPHVGFVVINMPMEPDWIICFYNQRGTAERHIKEGKQAINWTRLSCKGMAQNEVRLQLYALAYNLGVFLQRADLPEEMAEWSLTSLQTRLIKIGARVVRHARAITFQLAEVSVSGNLFTRILAAIHRLRAPPVPTLRRQRQNLKKSGLMGLSKRVSIRPNPPPRLKFVLNSRDRYPIHGTICKNGLIGTQNNYKLQETEIYLGNVSLIKSLGLIPECNKVSQKQKHLRKN